MSHGLDTVEFFVVTLRVHLSPRGQISVWSAAPDLPLPKSGSAFRISLRTADYKTAKLRAASIVSWTLSVKVAEDPEAALLALWSRLQALAAEPVRGEEDLQRTMAIELQGTI